MLNKDSNQPDWDKYIMERRCVDCSDFVKFPKWQYREVPMGPGQARPEEFTTCPSCKSELIKEVPFQR